MALLKKAITFSIIYLQADNVITVDNIAGTVQNVDEFYAIQPPNGLVNLQLLGLDTNRRLRSSTGNSFASDKG